MVNRREDSTLALLQRALGPQWSELPSSVKTTHVLVDDALELSGRGSVQRGESAIAQVVAGVFRFPKTNPDVPVTVEKRICAEGEIWLRNFNGHRFQSRLSLPTNKVGDGYIKERFGLLDFELALKVVDNSMNMPVNRGWFLGIPIPRPLLPVSITREYEHAGQMHFDVRLELPFSLGLLVHYKGHLSPISHAPS